MGDEPQETETTETTAEALPPEQEERIVDKVVAKVRDLVGTLTGAGDGDGEGGAGEAEPIETTPEPSTPRQVEAETEEQVRQALEKLKGEEEHRKEHEKIRELERPPAVVSRVTRALWGEP